MSGLLYTVQRDSTIHFYIDSLLCCGDRGTLAAPATSVREGATSIKIPKGDGNSIIKPLCCKPSLYSRKPGGALHWDVREEWRDTLGKPHGDGKLRKPSHRKFLSGEGGKLGLRQSSCWVLSMCVVRDTQYLPTGKRKPLGSRTGLYKMFALHRYLTDPLSLSGRRGRDFPPDHPLEGKPPFSAILLFRRVRAYGMPWLGYLEIAKSHIVKSKSWGTISTRFLRDSLMLSREIYFFVYILYMNKGPLK